MFSSLSGARLGVWVAHGEGKFSLPMGEDAYKITARYSYNGYPANPNGSDYDVASITSARWPSSGDDAASGAFHFSVELGLLRRNAPRR